jgi:hypothetical protein
MPHESACGTTTCLQLAQIDRLQSVTCGRRPAAPRRGQGDARGAQFQAAATAIAGRSIARRVTIARLADELS